MRNTLIPSVGEHAALALADLRNAQRAGASGCPSWGAKEVAWFTENCRSGQFDELGLVTLAASLRKLQDLREEDFASFRAALDSRNSMQEKIGEALGIPSDKAADLREILAAVQKLTAPLSDQRARSTGVTQ